MGMQWASEFSLYLLPKSSTFNGKVCNHFWLVTRVTIDDNGTERGSCGSYIGLYTVEDCKRLLRLRVRQRLGMRRRASQP